MPTNNEMSLRQLETEVQEWAKRNFPNNKPHMPLLGATEEVGELAHAHLKMEQGIRGTPEEHLAAKKDAVGDIIIYLADYCWRNGFSLAVVVEETWSQVKERDWQKNKKDGVTK